MSRKSWIVDVYILKQMFTCSHTTAYIMIWIERIGLSSIGTKKSNKQNIFTYLNRQLAEEVIVPSIKMYLHAEVFVL